MLVLRASCTRVWMGFLVQLVFISSVLFVPIRSAKNDRTTHQTKTRSLATIPESNHSYNPNLSNTFDKKNSSLFCTHGFFNLRPSKANHPSIISSFLDNRYRIKRCPPEYRAKLRSERLKARSKIQQRVDELKNERFTRSSKARTFPKSATESQRVNERKPMTDEKMSFENTTKAINLSDLTSSNNATNRGGMPNTSSTSNQTEKYGNESFFDNQKNIKKETEKIFEEYPKVSNTNLEGSIIKQTVLPVSNRNTSSEDFVPFESKTIKFNASPNTLYATSDFSNFLTDPSTSPMGTGNSTEINQNDSKTASTQQLTEGTTLLLNFEERHNSTISTPESNSPRPDLNFLTAHQSIPQILNSRDPLEPSNNRLISASKKEWLPQISKLGSLNASWELNNSGNTYNLEQDSRTDTDIVSPTLSQIPQKTFTPKISEDEKNSFDLNTNDTIEKNARFINDSKNEEGIPVDNLRGSLTSPTNHATQLQNIFTVDPRGSEERANPRDFETNHPAQSKIENMSENISENTDSNEYHHKNEPRHSRNHKNMNINAENEALPYSSFLRTYLHQPPESTIAEANFPSLFKSDTTKSSESNIPKTYRPSDEMKVESFTTSDSELNHDLRMTFILPANSAEASTNQNYPVATTPITESLEATEAYDVIPESINKENFSFKLQLNTESPTEKLEKNQNSSGKFEIINKLHERFGSTVHQTEEYGPILAELLQKENERNSSSPEIKMKQNLFGTVPRNKSSQTENSVQNSDEVMIKQSGTFEKTQKMAGQMKNVEIQAIQKMADQTKNNEQTQFLSTTNPTSFINYESHRPEIQISDSSSNFISATKTTNPQPEKQIFIQVHTDSSKIENLTSSLTDINHFTEEMENLSEDHSQVLVKKSLKHFPKLPADENSPFRPPAMVTDSANKYTTKKYKLKHFLGSSRGNLFNRRGLESTNLISKDQKSTHISPISPTESPREYGHPPITESLPTDSTFEFDFENNWTSSINSENETETPESFQHKDLPPFILFRNNSDSYPQNLVNLNVMRKTHKIQPGEVVPPMNPNENWKIGENDTYYTIEELKSFFKIKKKSLAAGKGTNKYSPEIVIDLNGLNETIIIDFLKQNLTGAPQNETISSNTTKYKTFRLFSNLTDNFISNGGKNESSNSTLIYSLIPQEELYERINSSKNASAASDLKLETSKYLNLFNLTGKDENAQKFVHALLSLNKTYLGPNLDFNKNDFNATRDNKNTSNGIGNEKDKLTGNTEVILVNLKDPQQEEELLEKIISGSNKIVVLAGNNATPLKNVNNVDEKINYAKDSTSFIKEFALSDEKNLLRTKSVEDIEETNITDRKIEGKSVITGLNNENEILSRRHNFMPGSSHHLKAKPRDPQEQLIRKQFSFVNPQIVDNFLDVYKKYSPRHSASRSKMKPPNYNNVRSTEDVDWIPKSQPSYRNQPPDNFITNFLRELVRLKNSVPAAYISHGYAN